MSLLITTRRRVVVAASGVALVGAAGAFALTSGAFASSTPTPSAPTPPTPATSSTTSTTSLPSTGRSGAPKCNIKGLAHGRGLLARTDYATVEVFRQGHWETVVLDRGDVTAVSTSRITIRRPDGVTVTLALASTTKYHGVASARDLMTNRQASVISADGSALRVAQVVRSASATR